MPTTTLQYLRARRGSSGRGPHVTTRSARPTSSTRDRSWPSPIAPRPRRSLLADALAPRPRPGLLRRHHRVCAGAAGDGRHRTGRPRRCRPGPRLAPPAHLAELHRIASAVSDPRHPKYGEFLSLAEVNELTAPSASTSPPRAAWLAPAAVGAVETLPSGAVRARLHAGRAAALLRTSFTEIEEAASGRRLVRAGAYRAAGADRRRRRGDLRPPRAPAAADGEVRPLVGGPPAAAGPAAEPGAKGGAVGDRRPVPDGSGEGVRQRQVPPAAEFQGDMAATDVEKFFAEYVASAPASAAEVYAIHGEPQQGDGVEAIARTSHARVQSRMRPVVSPGLKTEFFEQMSMTCAGISRTGRRSSRDRRRPPRALGLVRLAGGPLPGAVHAGKTTAVIDADYAKRAARGSPSSSRVATRARGTRRRRRRRRSAGCRRGRRACCMTRRLITCSA